MSELKLNLGCGSQVVDGWQNVDWSIGARLAKLPVLGWAVRKSGLFDHRWDPRIKLHDLRKPLPWANDSVDVIYSSHTLEHLARDAGRDLLRECCRVLKPGGVMRILVPDLKHLVERYRSGELAPEDFVEKLGVLYGVGKTGLKHLVAPFVEFPHRCMYDTPGMIRILQEFGLDAEARLGFDSRITDIRVMELPDRVEGAVVVEAVKPKDTLSA
jgi:SAM-dependent methyltransferase